MDQILYRTLDPHKKRRLYNFREIREKWKVETLAQPLGGLRSSRIRDKDRPTPDFAKFVTSNASYSDMAFFAHANYLAK